MVSETTICYMVLATFTPVLLFLARIVYVLPAVQAPPARKPPLSIQPNTCITIVLGSGGHTGEMIRMLGQMDLTNVNRTWLVSSGDTTSLQKAKALDEQVTGKSVYATVYRARKVKEPLLSSVKSTLSSFISLLSQIRSVPTPDVLLLNGPGTCVPVAYVYFIMKVFGLCNTKIVYVESLARVNSLSLTGKLVMPIANRFLVQWKPLAYKYRRAEYHGILV